MLPAQGRKETRGDRKKNASRMNPNFRVERLSSKRGKGQTSAGSEATFWFRLSKSGACHSHVRMQQACRAGLQNQGIGFRIHV